jgi:hypothetical protein
MVEANIQPQDMSCVDMWQIGLEGVIEMAFQTENSEQATLRADKEELLASVKTSL